MRGKSRLGRLWSLATIAVLVVTACGADDITDDAAPRSSGSDSASAPSGQGWDAVLTAAKEEGRVVVYTATPPPVITRLQADFQDAYPDIKLEFNRAASGDLIAKLDQERQATADGGDVFISTELGWFEQRAAEGSLRPLAGPAEPEFPADYKIGTGTVAIAGMEPLTILYNTNVNPTAPTSYDDLLDPALKGKLGSSDLAATTVVAWYDWLRETQGDDYWQNLADQDIRFYHGAVPLAQAVASGEIAASAFGNTSAVQPLIDQGAPIKYVVTEPSLGFRYATAALSSAKRPNAAQVFVDYLMSERGQKVWHGTGESASPLDVAGAIPADKITPYDPTDYPADVAQKVTDEWNAVFKP